MGTNVTPASIASAVWAAQDLTTRQILGSGSLTVASISFGQLQTGPPWTQDAVGYNLLVQLGAVVTSGPGNKVLVTITLIDSGGNSILVPFIFYLSP